MDTDLNIAYYISFDLVFYRCIGAGGDEDVATPTDEVASTGIYGYEIAAGVGVASMLLAMETLKLASNQASGKVAKSSSDSSTFGSQPQWDCSRAKYVMLMHVERFNQLQEGRN